MLNWQLAPLILFILFILLVYFMFQDFMGDRIYPWLFQRVFAECGCLQGLQAISNTFLIPAI